MNRIAATVASFFYLTLLAAAAPAQGNIEDYELAYATCPAITDRDARLNCFDRYAGADEAEGPLLGYGIDGLTSHEPNKLMARTDSQDESRLYMDANLSVKHQVLNPVVDTLSSLLNIDRRRNTPRLYLAFTTRFSQYIASRESAPVVPRSYNPELFLRVWRDGVYERTNPSYWDFGYGHESNGQRIADPESYQQARFQAVQRGDPARSARDELSRGWDYLSIDWHKQWNTPLLQAFPGQTETHFEYRHYLDDGLFQGGPEEYQSWEGDGPGARPRDRYDGLEMSIEYNWNRVDCSGLVCFRKLGLIHQTGYAKPFEHNTTTMELTTELVGINLLLWARTGYNSDLIDYYQYTNSWGLGMEFFR